MHETLYPIGFIEPSPDSSLPARICNLVTKMQLDPKRRPRQEIGRESWYPYYAGFNESFVGKILDAAELPFGSMILDPWNGSGTTTTEAVLRGYNAVGIDINPVATLVSSAKLVSPIDVAKAPRLAWTIAEEARVACYPSTESDPLRAWLFEGVVDLYRSIERRILSNLSEGIEDPKTLLTTDALPPLTSFLLLALMRASRSLATIRKTSNPAWVRPGQPFQITPEKLFSRWEKIVTKMAADSQINHVEPAPKFQILKGDARAISLPDGIVDLVITSPPYCTRLDYVVNTSFELAALGIGPQHEQYDILRRACMGTPLSRSDMIGDLSDCPMSIQEVVERIRRHSSKASQSYYYKTYAQYFKDAVVASREIFRVLRPGGVALLVLQSSYYKDIYIDLPALWVDIAHHIGFMARELHSINIGRSISQSNRRSTMYRPTTRYRESSILLEKSSGHSENSEEWKNEPNRFEEFAAR